jgi:hypothetical protein
VRVTEADETEARFAGAAFAVGVAAFGAAWTGDVGAAFAFDTGVSTGHPCDVGDVCATAVFTSIKLADIANAEMRTVNSAMLRILYNRQLPLDDRSSQKRQPCMALHHVDNRVGSFGAAWPRWAMRDGRSGARAR